nr:LysO family transporter [uncultured Bacteroides sp.]
MFVITIILFIAAGIFAGYRLRNKETGIVSRIVTGFIWLLLFLLGMEVGSNEKLIKGIYVFGLEALILTIAGVIGSVLASWGLWLYISKNNLKKEGKK